PGADASPSPPGQVMRIGSSWLGLAVLVPALGVAQAWVDFRPAFPAHPCTDGWAGCMVDEVRVGNGETLPTDLRVDWFDLTPTAVFSPFGGLSAYTGERPKVPVAEPEAVPVPEPPPAVAVTRPPSPEPTPEPVAVARVERKARPVPEPEPEPEAPEGCADLVRLEGPAMLGQLDNDQVTCLEQRVGSGAKQTTRSHASHVLIANAWGARRLERWESLVLRHLQEIDRSNPALCYKLALHLEQQGPARAAEVIRWSELAMENARREWTQEQYTDKMYSLHRLRSKAAHELWYVTEQRHAEAPTAESSEAMETYRGRAKNFSKEWLLYAERVGKDTTHPREMCLSAAGTSEFCEAT
ncbi:MAG: hypothetical protein AAF211_28945, partial [Myxococcota bacterium]